MKTTFEIPDSLFRKAKAKAARKGQTMTAFVTSAIQAKLDEDIEMAREKPWMAFAGVFRGERAESREIMRRIEEACERVDPEDWR